ncbi:MAG: STAS domain-containing protein [Spirochaetales bacterium]|nr:STAS domain-containing protein [Spirochaetales bacterium]
MASVYFEEFNSMNFDTKVISRFLDADRTQLAVKIRGNMETYYSNHFTSAVLDIFKSEHSLESLFLDLESIEYISSSFIASLLQILNHANHNHIELVFVNLNDHTKRMVKALGLGQFIKEMSLEMKNALSMECSHCGQRVLVKTLENFNCPYCQTVLNYMQKGLVS